MCWSDGTGLTPTGLGILNLSPATDCDANLPPPSPPLASPSPAPPTPAACVELAERARGREDYIAKFSGLRDDCYDTNNLNTCPTLFRWTTDVYDGIIVCRVNNDGDACENGPEERCPIVASPPPPPCDLSYCIGASGAAAVHCGEAVRIECCINYGGMQDDCCVGASPPMFGGVGIPRLEPCKPKPPPPPPCDVSYCRGCGGSSCGYCYEAKTIECCMNNGGTQVGCCEGASRYMYSGAEGLIPCASSPPPALPPAPPPAPKPPCDLSYCIGASGAAAVHCGEALRIECCMTDGGSQLQCCEGASLSMYGGAGIPRLEPCKPKPPPSPPCDVSYCYGCKGLPCGYCYTKRRGSSAASPTVARRSDAARARLATCTMARQG